MRCTNVLTNKLKYYYENLLLFNPIETEISLGAALRHYSYKSKLICCLTWKKERKTIDNYGIIREQKHGNMNISIYLEKR